MSLWWLLENIHYTFKIIIQFCVALWFIHISLENDIQFCATRCSDSQLGFHLRVGCHSHFQFSKTKCLLVSKIVVYSMCFYVLCCFVFSRKIISCVCLENNIFSCVTLLFQHKMLCYILFINTICCGMF